MHVIVVSDSEQVVGPRIPRKHMLAFAEAALIVAGKDEELEESAQALVHACGRFSEGDQVAWHESPRHPNNIGVVLDGPILLGFSELPPGRRGLGYRCEFPGPMGIGREEYDIVEDELITPAEAYERNGGLGEPYYTREMTKAGRAGH
jgi:hypothetical protein